MFPEFGHLVLLFGSPNPPPTGLILSCCNGISQWPLRRHQNNFIFVACNWAACSSQGQMARVSPNCSACSVHAARHTLSCPLVNTCMLPRKCLWILIGHTYSLLQLTFLGHSWIRLNSLAFQHKTHLDQWKRSQKHYCASCDTSKPLRGTGNTAFLTKALMLDKTIRRGLPPKMNRISYP